MINISLKDVINCADELSQLMKVNLPARTAFSVAKIVNQIKSELENYQKIRKQLIMRYCEVDDNNKLKTDIDGNAIVAQGNEAVFQKEFNELLDMNIEINAEKIALKDLENLNFSPAQMIHLAPFIQE